MALRPVENLKRAFECDLLPERVPLWELHFHCWEQAAGKHLIIGSEFASLSPKDQSIALDEDADLIAETASRYQFAAVTIPDGYWETAPGVPAYYWLPEQARLDLATRLARLGEQCGFMVIAACGGILGMPGPDNYLEFSYLLHDTPEQVDDMAQAKLHRGIDRAAVMRAAGIGAVYAAADLADNHGPYFNPAQMQRYIYPYLGRWAEAVRSLGMYAILHTDGNINPILPGLLESGIHALQAIDPVAGMDIRRVKAAAQGRVCLCGNVDCGLLFNGPAEAVYQVTRELLLDCKGGGGFVLGASNAVQQDTPIGHYEAMLRAWNEFGGYP